MGSPEKLLGKVTSELVFSERGHLSRGVLLCRLCCALGLGGTGLGGCLTLGLVWTGSYVRQSRLRPDHCPVGKPQVRAGAGRGSNGNLRCWELSGGGRMATGGADGEASWRPAPGAWGWGSCWRQAHGTDSMCSIVDGSGYETLGVRRSREWAHDKGRGLSPLEPLFLLQHPEEEPLGWRTGQQGRRVCVCVCVCV